MRDSILSRPIFSAALTGATAAAILPILSTLSKIVMCSYGLTTDYSGSMLFTQLPIIIGFVAGAVCGALGMLLGNLLTTLNAGSRSKPAGTVIGIVLAAAAGLAIGLLPAGMIMFPDC